MTSEALTKLSKQKNRTRLVTDLEALGFSQPEIYLYPTEGYDTGENSQIHPSHIKRALLKGYFIKATL